MRVRRRWQTALSAGQLDALQKLEAVQARMFVRAVRSQDFAAPASAELLALGGDFVKRALSNGWAGPHGCIASDDELRTLFERRWVELSHLRDNPRFKPTLAELRRYYRFLLLYPERIQSGDTPARERASVRLRYVDALSRRDTEYPVALARGSLLAELGMMQDSAQALGLQLARPEGAEWRLRARNYLLFAAENRSADQGEALPFDTP